MQRPKASDGTREGRPSTGKSIQFCAKLYSRLHALPLSRFRVFFLACAELFNFNKNGLGEEWGLGHYLYVFLRLLSKEIAPSLTPSNTLVLRNELFNARSTKRVRVAKKVFESI